jgi:hypothetical protein
VIYDQDIMYSKLIEGFFDVVSPLSTVDYCRVPQGVISST